MDIRLSEQIAIYHVIWSTQPPSLRRNE